MASVQVAFFSVVFMLYNVGNQKVFYELWKHLKCIKVFSNELLTSISVELVMFTNNGLQTYIQHVPPTLPRLHKIADLASPTPIDSTLGLRASQPLIFQQMTRPQCVHYSEVPLYSQYSVSLTTNGLFNP